MSNLAFSIYTVYCIAHSYYKDIWYTGLVSISQHRVHFRAVSVLCRSFRYSQTAVHCHKTVPYGRKKRRLRPVLNSVYVCDIRRMCCNPGLHNLCTKPYKAHLKRNPSKEEWINLRILATVSLSVDCASAATLCINCCNSLLELGGSSSTFDCVWSILYLKWRCQVLQYKYLCYFPNQFYFPAVKVQYTAWAWQSRGSMGGMELALQFSIHTVFPGIQRLYVVYWPLENSCSVVLGVVLLLPKMKCDKKKCTPMSLTYSPSISSYLTVTLGPVLPP